MNHALQLRRKTQSAKVLVEELSKKYLLYRNLHNELLENCKEPLRAECIDVEHIKQRTLRDATTMTAKHIEAEMI